MTHPMNRSTILLFSRAMVSRLRSLLRLEWAEGRSLPPKQMPRSLLGGCLLLATIVLGRAAELSPQHERGRAVFSLYCVACHQLNGEGTRGVFPPLAGSDFLLADKERSIGIVLQGLSGQIVVNGAEYNGVMPAPGVPDDEKVADVLTFVRNSWGNRGGPVTVAEVQAVRARLAAANRQKPDPYAPVPMPPAGFRVREVAQLPVNCVRLAAMPGTRWIFVLNDGGELFRLEPATGNLVRVLAAKDFADLAPGKIDALGMTIDSRRRLYLATNQRVAARPHQLNHIVIYRSAPLDAEGVPTGVKPWLRTTYPWGVGPYNHGIGHIAEGPDGMLYVSSGSRTDGGETGSDPALWTGGETKLTAGIWRLDPRQDAPAIEMFARGIRNAWGFAWNNRGELFSASNGPDAHQPEELDFVQAGKHYGFPHQFADTTAKPYPYTPDGPAGVTFTPAIRNFGPAAGGSAEKPIASFDPHSSPSGMIFCGPEWPAAVRGKFLIARFGNFLLEQDLGFDILAVDLKRNAAGVYEARMETFLAPLARPIDLLQVGRKLYILEYARATNKTSGRPMSSGRILELSW